MEFSQARAVEPGGVRPSSAHAKLMEGRAREAHQRAMDAAHALTPYEVIDLDTDESHGTYETLAEARRRLRFDGLSEYQIWRGDRLVEECGGNAVDPENIYSLSSIRQSIEEERKR